LFRDYMGRSAVAMVPYDPRAAAAAQDGGDLTTRVIATPTQLTSDHRRRSSGAQGGMAGAALRAHMGRRMCSARVMYLSGLLLLLLGLSTTVFVAARFSAEIDAAAAGSKLALGGTHNTSAAAAAAAAAAPPSANAPLTMRRNATLALLAFQHAQAPLDAQEAGRAPLSLALPAIGGARYWAIAIALLVAALGGAGMRAANAAAGGMGDGHGDDTAAVAAAAAAERAHRHLPSLVAAACGLGVAVWLIGADAIRHGTAAAASEGLGGMSGSTPPGGSLLGGGGLGDMGRVGLLLLSVLGALLTFGGAALRVAGLRAVAPPFLEALCALYALLGGVLVLLAAYALK
jgi:hypothetical protein